jgi:hypothetical protein
MVIWTWNADNPIAIDGRLIALLWAPKFDEVAGSQLCMGCT